MRTRLLSDPTVLVISPRAGALSYSKAFIDKIASYEGTRFAIGRIREIATDMTLQKEGGKSAVVHMEPSAPGEPLLLRYNLPSPKDGDCPQIVLAAKAAQKLGVQKGDTVHALLGRKTKDGRFESMRIAITVSGIMPKESSDRVLGFLPLTFMEDVQDYRDFIAVPSRGMEGDARKSEREYASFRLYAKDLDAVEELSVLLASEGVDVRTKAHEIAAIRSLDTALNRVILILSFAIGCGFMAFTVSSAKGSVERKRRMLGLLRLLGFSRREIIVYPLVQSFLTCFSGILLALLCYGAVSCAIESLFAQQSGGLALCHLPLATFGSACGIVFLLSGFSALYSALKAASVDPASVIREA